MPWVRAEHVRSLIAAFHPEEGRSVCVPVYDRKRGNPVLWDKRFFPAMSRLTGDVGARQLLVEHAEAVVEVPVADGGVTVDIDTPEALEALGKT
jgi:molybdenum cofactor cytidylyltransferase